MQNEKLRSPHKPSKCPKCGSEKIATVFYGYPDPTPKMQKAFDEGRLVVGGCEISGDDPVWQCTACGTEIYRG